MSFWSHPHLTLGPVAFGVGVIAWYLEATRAPCQAARRQRGAFLAGVVVLVIALSWPVASLAGTTSLLAVVVQREMLAFAAAPLMLYGITVEIGVRLTRPAPVDWVVARLSEPVPAIVSTVVVFGVTSLPITISAAGRLPALRALIEAATFGAGLVVWNPVVRRIPGVRELTPLGRSGYLLVQSFAPTYLSFAWIFAPHPLYASLHGQQDVLGITPLFDQRMAGYIAKLVTFGVLWPIAYRLFSRNLDSPPPETVLRWSDIERQLERSDRQLRRVKDHQR